MPEAAAGLLLDTHCWVWFACGESRRLGQRTIESIRSAGREARLYLAAISLWEVAMLAAKGRVELGREPEAWLREAVLRTCVSIVPIDAEVAARSCAVPLFQHDPADRLIVASALIVQAILLTSDALIHKAARRLGLRVRKP